MGGTTNTASGSVAHGPHPSAMHSQILPGSQAAMDGGGGGGRARGSVRSQVAPPSPSTLGVKAPGIGDDADLIEAGGARPRGEVPRRVGLATIGAGDGTVQLPRPAADIEQGQARFEVWKQIGGGVQGGAPTMGAQHRFVVSVGVRGARQRWTPESAAMMQPPRTLSAFSNHECSSHPLRFCGRNASACGARLHTPALSGGHRAARSCPRAAPPRTGSSARGHVGNNSRAAGFGPSLAVETAAVR